MTYDEPMPWMLEKMLDELGLTKKQVDDRVEAKLAVNREPRDVSWYKRGEECPH